MSIALSGGMPPCSTAACSMYGTWLLAVLWKAVVRPCLTAALPGGALLRFFLQDEHGEGVGSKVPPGSACVWRLAVGLECILGLHWD